MSNKKYHISIEGTGTAEEIVRSLSVIYDNIEADYAMKEEWKNDQNIAGTNEYCYSDDGVLRTEVNER